MRWVFAPRQSRREQVGAFVTAHGRVWSERLGRRIALHPLWSSCQSSGMSRIVPLGLAAWPRASYFEHYFRASPCSFSITSTVDTTELAREIRRLGQPTYSAHVWAVANILNQHDEFRLVVDESGSVGVWESIDPAFTIFHPEDETFSSLACEYDESYAVFRARMSETVERYRHERGLFPQEKIPVNSFDISCLPWLAFTGNTLDIPGAVRRLAPIVTLGKQHADGDRMVMPLAFQINHAVADGFHVARFFSELQALVDAPSWLE